MSSVNQRARVVACVNMRVCTSVRALEDKRVKSADLNKKKGTCESADADSTQHTSGAAKDTTLCQIKHQSHDTHVSSPNIRAHKLNS